MKIFLTGAAVLFGQPLTQSLLERGWQVIASVRKPDRPQAQALTIMGAQCVKGDDEVIWRELRRAKKKVQGSE